MKCSPNSRCRPSSCLLAVLAMFSANIRLLPTSEMFHHFVVTTKTTQPLLQVFYNPRQKSWNTCVIFRCPMLIWVCSHFSAPKYARLNIGEGERHIWVRTKVWSVNVRNLEKIQDRWLLFQRFVTSIVGWRFNYLAILLHDWRPFSHIAKCFQGRQ